MSGLVPRGAWRPLLIVFLAHLAACQSAHIPVPDELAAGDRWTVQGRQGWKLRETIRFGPYEAGNVHRSWTRGLDQDANVFERHDRRQSYSFALRDGGVDTWLVKCETAHERGTVRTPIVDLDLHNRSDLSCALTEASGTETWLLTLHETREQPLDGLLEGEAFAFTVRGTSKLQKSLPNAQTTGYYISADDRSVAAIEVVNRGSVTILPSLEAGTISLLSAASAALLLLEELRAEAES